MDFYYLMNIWGGGGGVRIAGHVYTLIPLFPFSILHSQPHSFPHRASEPNFVYSEVFYTRALQLDAAHTPALSYLASLYLETGRQAQADETAAALAQACGNACCEDLQYLLKDYAALDSELPSGLPMCSVDASSEEQIVGGQSSAAFVPVMAPLVLVVFGMAAAAA